MAMKRTTPAATRATVRQVVSRQATRASCVPWVAVAMSG